ncbi:DsbA family protein [Phenylobacterium sp.]|jgi:protein-disulfide isomerase|uniref:DsbA family protein n=2 Tax=Phenylobacterium sp. TaxID=1871053 RepID=UPI0037C870C4
MKAALLLAAAVVLAGCQQQAPDAAFGAKVRAYLLEHPEVIEEAVGKLQQTRMLEQARARASDIERYREQLERDPRDFVVNPNGAFTLVQFFDYRCGYCKVVAPEILKLARENPDVRVVFKEFPIFGAASDSAARIALTPQVKAKGVDLHQAMMADRGLDEAALDAHLRRVGLDPAAVRRAASSPGIAAQIQETRLLAQALGLEGTPAFIVGDYLIPGADMNAVRAALARVRAGGLKKPPSAPT